MKIQVGYSDSQTKEFDSGEVASLCERVDPPLLVKYQTNPRTSPMKEETVPLQTDKEHEPESNKPEADVVGFEVDLTPVKKQTTILTLFKSDDVSLEPKAVNEDLTRSQFIITYITVLVGLFVVTLDYSIVPTAIPTIITEFKVLNMTSWIGCAYLITTAATAPIYGGLCNLFGRKLMYFCALALFTAGYIVCSVAQNINVLIVGRGISGLGTGGLLTVCMIILADTVNLEDRGKAQGFVGTLLVVSSVIGVALGTWFITFNWRYCFLPSILLCAIAMFLLYFVHFEKVYKKSNLDFGGSLLIICASTCGVIPLVLGNTWNWNYVTIILIVISALLFLVLGYAEYKHENPIIPAKVFKNSTVGILMVYSTFVGICYQSLVYFMPLFFQLVVFDTIRNSGYKSLSFFIPLGLMINLAGYVASKTGRYKIFFYLAPLIMLSGFSIGSVLDQNSSLALTIVAFALSGLGLGCVMHIRVLAIQASLPYADVPLATATSNFFYIFGGVLGVGIFGSIFNNSLSNQLSGTLLTLANGPPPKVRALDAATTEIILNALSRSLGNTYYFSICIAGLMFFMTVFIKEYYFKGDLPK
ncbi:hypothetical protein HDV06_002071 [Boothiomyces sp. JEL0866]|nr:hypothetical protein HDV06_002071 [Boothiomyces sp. JEL0866]